MELWIAVSKKPDKRGDYATSTWAVKDKSRLEEIFKDGFEIIEVKTNDDQ